jgi:hypothetical protein
LDLPAVEPEETKAPTDVIDSEPVAAAWGRGGTSRKPKGADARTAKRIKGRTIYLPDDLFERILVQSHRRNRTSSDYVVSILERQVPDHRIAPTTCRPGPAWRCRLHVATANLDPHDQRHRTHPGAKSCGLLCARGMPLSVARQSAQPARSYMRTPTS